MDRETVITHLQIIHTWAEFAREHDLQFFTAKHLEDIAQWTHDVIELLKEQQETIELQGSLLTLAHVAMSHGKKEGTRDIARPGRNRENPASHV